MLKRSEAEIFVWSTRGLSDREPPIEPDVGISANTLTPIQPILTVAPAL